MKSYWHYVDAIEGFKRYRSEWDQLNAELYSSNPYFDTKFILNLIKHFPADGLLLGIYCPQQTVEGLLLVHPTGLGKWSIYKPEQAQIAPILVTDKSYLHSLIKSMSRSIIALDCLAQDPDFSKLSGNVSVGHSVLDYAHTVATCIDSEFADYWESRPKKLRQNVQRRLRRVSDLKYALRFEVLTHPDAMQDAVRYYGELETQGWKGRAGTAVNANNIQGRFYADLMYDFALADRARVYQLRFNDQIVAMRLAVCSSDMLVMLKTTYDEGHSKLSPGRLLLYKVLEREFEERQYRTIEFFTNANADLMAWTNSDRWLHHYTLYRHSWIAAAHQLFRRWRKPWGASD